MVRLGFNDKRLSVSSLLPHVADVKDAVSEIIVNDKMYLLVINN